MTALHGSVARLYVSGYDLTAFMRSATHAQSADVADKTVWGNGSKAYVAGLIDATFSGEGIFDSAPAPGSADKIDDVLSAALGGQSPLLYLPQGDVLAAPARIIDAIHSAYEITTPVDDVGALTFEAQSSQVEGVGRILRPLAGALNVSGNGNGTAVDDTSYLQSPGATALGGVGEAQIISKGGGAGNLTLRIEDSADGSTGWASILSFTLQSTQTHAEIVRINGTVRRWLRAAWTCTGGTWDFAVAFARRMPAV